MTGAPDSKSCVLSLPLPLPASLSWGAGVLGAVASQTLGQVVASISRASLNGHLWPVLRRRLWSLAALDPRDCQVRGLGPRGGQVTPPATAQSRVWAALTGVLDDPGPPVPVDHGPLCWAAGSSQHGLPGGPAVDGSGHRAATHWPPTVQLQLLVQACCLFEALPAGVAWPLGAEAAAPGARPPGTSAGHELLL